MKQPTTIEVITTSDEDTIAGYRINVGKPFGSKTALDAIIIGSFSDWRDGRFGQGSLLPSMTASEARRLAKALELAADVLEGA